MDLFLGQNPGAASLRLAGMAAVQEKKGKRIEALRGFVLHPIDEAESLAKELWRKSNTSRSLNSKRARRRNIWTRCSINSWSCPNPSTGSRIMWVERTTVLRA